MTLLDQNPQNIDPLEEPGLEVPVDDRQRVVPAIEFKDVELAFDDKVVLDKPMTLQVSEFAGLDSASLRFDLPVDTRDARHAYAQFRKFLLRDGFSQVQYSIYARVCASEAAVQVHARRVESRVPDDGEVRLLCITDKQFERQRIFQGKLRKQPQKAPKQLEFF